MSHEKSSTYEIDGKHYVVNTAGFRSDDAAINATFSKKNKKRKRPTPYKTDKEAQAASRKRSAKTDKVVQKNSRASGYFKRRTRPDPNHKD
jgi:hypothetical protein